MTTATTARDSALARVERHASPEWIAAANKAVRSCARILHEITTDDVWGALDWMNAYTHEPRAMGAVMKQAVADGIIEPTGTYRKSVRVACHARPVLVYRSLVRGA